MRLAILATISASPFRDRVSCSPRVDINPPVANQPSKMSLEDTISRLLSTRPPPAEPELRAAVDEHERSQASERQRPIEVAPDLSPPPAPVSVTTTGICGVCQERVDDGRPNAGRRPGCGHSIHMTCFARLVRSNRARCTLCPAPAVDSESAERLGGYTVDVGHDADVHASVAQALEYRRITVRDELIVEAHAKMGTFDASTRERAHTANPDAIQGEQARPIQL